MRRILSLFVIVMFLANTIIVSAWAHLCVNVSVPEIVSVASDKNGMPCNEEQNEKDKAIKHCDGVCLCYHLATNQLPLLGEYTNMLDALPKVDRITNANRSYVSTNIAPPSPPPKSLS